jgi:hypothetical protein
MHASLLHMTTQEVIVVMTPKSKRWDVTLRHCADHSVGTESEATQVLRGCAPASGCLTVASWSSLGASTSWDGR